MASHANNMRCILFMAVWAVIVEEAAATTVTRDDVMFEWLKITALPLGVFLIGACIWSCIKNTAVWRSLTGRGGDANAPVERPTDSNRDASDLEVGLELSHCRNMDDDMATISEKALTVQNPPLEFSNGDGKSATTAAQK